MKVLPDDHIQFPAVLDRDFLKKREISLYASKPIRYSIDELLNNKKEYLRTPGLCYTYSLDPYVLSTEYTCPFKDCGSQSNQISDCGRTEKFTSSEWEVIHNITAGLEGHLGDLLEDRTSNLGESEDLEVAVDKSEFWKHYF